MYTLLFAALLQCPPAWDYQHQSSWGGECAAGHAQSPIVIAKASTKELPPLRFRYAPFAAPVLNTSRTTEVEVPHGTVERLQQGKATYELLQFHFHFPAEHLEGGVAHAGELHLVHRDPTTKKLHVVAIWIDRGATNAALAPIVMLATNLAGCKTSAKSATINPALLLPDTSSYETYTGSLTTPPCTEGVTFILLGNTITASAEQIAALSRGEVNARAAQPVGARKVYLRRAP
jgi:carbonic anhydrase